MARATVTLDQARANIARTFKAHRIACTKADSEGQYVTVIRSLHSDDQGASGRAKTAYRRYMQALDEFHAIKNAQEVR